MDIPPHRRAAGTTAPSPEQPRPRRAERVARLTGLSERQLGLASHAQLRQLGWTLAQIDHEIRTGRWARRAPTVVGLSTGELTSRQCLWLGVLHAGAGAALSHISAAEESGLTWLRDDHIVHVLTPKGDLVPPLRGFLFHQTRRPYAAWVHASMQPPRLNLEHAVLLSAERDRSVRRAIGLLAAAVQQRLSTADRLLATSVQIRKLRNGAQFRLALGDIAGGAQSFAEIDIGRLCREAGLAPPSRQRFRRDKNGRSRYLDCEWDLPDGRSIVLEIDGSFHVEVGKWWQDMKRERSVVIAKSSVLRCSTIEIRLQPEDIVDDLRKIGVPVAQGFAA